MPGCYTRRSAAQLLQLAEQPAGTFAPPTRVVDTISKLAVGGHDDDVAHGVFRELTHDLVDDRVVAGSQCVDDAHVPVAADRDTRLRGSLEDEHNLVVRQRSSRQLFVQAPRRAGAIAPPAVRLLPTTLAASTISRPHQSTVGTTVTRRACEAGGARWQNLECRAAWRTPPSLARPAGMICSSGRRRGEKSVTGQLRRIRAIVPIDRMLGAYLLLTLATIVVIAGAAPSPDVVYVVVAALVVRDLLFGVSAALLWRRESLGRGLARLFFASVAGSMRRRW